MACDFIQLANIKILASFVICEKLSFKFLSYTACIKGPDDSELAGSRGARFLVLVE